MAPCSRINAACAPRAVPHSSSPASLPRTSSAWPTAPAAPWTSTRWPCFTRAARWRSFYAVVQLKISVAASAGSEARRHPGQAVSPERAIGGVRPNDRHVGDAVARIKAGHAGAELIDLSDDLIAHNEGRPVTHCCG
jgi:hypothetical protein